MKNSAKYAAVLIAGIIVGLLFSAVSTDGKLGGVYSQTLQYFYNGISVGKAGEFTVSNAGVVSTTGTLSTGDITSAGDVAVSNTGTTTLSISSSTSGRGGCIQLESTNGSTTRIFLAATTTTLTIEEGTCQ